MASSEAIVEYKFHEDTLEATIDDEIVLKVDCSTPLADPKLELMINNENYLNYKFCDPPNRRFHEGFQMSLSQYINSLKAKEVFPVTLYKVVEGLTDITVYVVPEEYRTLARGMINFLFCMHDGPKLSLLDAPLDLENFVISNGTLKVWGVKFRRSTLQSRIRDFRLMHDVLRHHVFANCNNIPYDFRKFLYRMHNYREWQQNRQKNGKLLMNHFAILTNAKRVQFMINAVNRQHHLGPHPNYRRVINNMKIRQINWSRRFSRQSRDLPALALRRSKCATEEHKHVCGSREAVKYLSVTYNDASIDYNHNYGILRFCRNLAVHLPEDLRKDSNFPKGFNDADVDAMICHLFLEELVDFQESASKEGCLEFFIV